MINMTERLRERYGQFRRFRHIIQEVFATALAMAEIMAERVPAAGAPKRAG
jgi:hypothetical protein